MNPGLHSREIFGFREFGEPKFFGYITFQQNPCYHASHGITRRQKRNLFGVKLDIREVPKTIFWTAVAQVAT